MSTFISLLQKLGFTISLIAALVLLDCNTLHAQITAGNASFNFLTLPHSAKASALGGMNISAIGEDPGLVMFNPSLMTENMNGSMHLGIKPYFAGIQQYDLFGVSHWEKKKVSFGWGVHYLNYGNIPMTDIAGNELGTMRPTDYALQVSAATDYIQNFRIGSTLKYIQSRYGMYHSSGLSMDVGLTYLSPTHLSRSSILVKNIGTQIATTGVRQALPFNLILGWSKKLAQAPIQFSVTADRLSVWNNTYYDPVYATENGISAPRNFQNLLNHLLISSEVFIGNQFELNLGYNFSRRYDLNIVNQVNGLNGFSSGIGFKLDKMQIQYGNAAFQSNFYHHFSVVYQFKNKGN
jgi:hypothetical protein